MSELTENIDQAIKIVTNEIFMRSKMKDVSMRFKKVAEMTFVKTLLINYKVDTGRRIQNANKRT